ncbi:MAG: YggS family pyridoxal phosphate-dependent enzyme [bacterium]|nr:YggS family pyridoxal phosphate-dependent enzyme [bacterium]
MTIADNWRALEARVRARARQPVEIVAVTKQRSPAEIAAVIAAGARILGENRSEEIVRKCSAHDPRADMPGLQLHMIGHVQSRKARDIAARCDAVQSLDSAHLADELNQRRAPASRPLDVLIEVNVGGEAQKYGVAPAAVVGLAEHVLTLPWLRLRGLMTMAPQTDDAARIRAAFRGLRELRDQLVPRLGAAPCAVLSMGMSDDFEIAVEEGSTMVRIGQALFADSFDKEPQEEKRVIRAGATAASFNKE